MTQLSMIDTASLLYAYLRAQPELTAMITSGGRVHLYGPPGLPDNWTLTPAVVFTRGGGSVSDDLPYMEETMAFRCYGPTLWDAAALYRALAACLIRIRPQWVSVGAQRGLLQYAALVSGPIDSLEPMTYWPVILATFLIRSGQYGMASI